MVTHASVRVVSKKLTSNIKVKWYGISLVHTLQKEHYMTAWRFEIPCPGVKYFFSIMSEKFCISAQPCIMLCLFFLTGFS